MAISQFPTFGIGSRFICYVRQPGLASCAPHDVETMDDDLMEALCCFSEEMASPVQVSSSPVTVGTAADSKLNDQLLPDEAMNSMLLSLEVQELLSSDEQSLLNKPEPDSQQQQPSPPKKIDRRLKPYSTAKRRNRKRPKHELEYLRAKVAELQEALEELNKATPSTDAQKLTLASSNWKSVAERQKREVDSSIDENRKLRNRLVGQLQVARVLEAAIAQHQNDTGGAPMSGVGRPLAMNMTDQQIFAQLNSAVETQFAEVSTVLGTKSLSNVCHTLQDGLEFKREADGISFRHEEARLLPFSMHAFHHAIWNCLHNGTVVEQTQTQMLNEDHSNLIFQGTLELPKANRVNVTKRAAFRRHIEKDRVVFVWSSYVEIDGSASVRVREKGWSTCSAFEFYRGVTAGSSSSRNFVQGCLARMVVQLTPEVSKFTSEKEAQLHIGEVTDLIVGTYRHNFGLIHEVAERVLLSAVKVKPDTEGDSYGKVIFM